VALIGLHMTPLALEAYIHEYCVTHPLDMDASVTGQPIPATMQTYALRGTPTLILSIRFHEFGRTDDLQVVILLGRLLSEE
jgi:hypothetical protein